VVTALQAVRGIDLIGAVAVLAEVGDLSRFRNPRELMAYLGLVPSESSTGDRPAMGAPGASWSKQLGRIAILHALHERNSQKWRPHQRPRVRLPGRRK
jgi:transposase